MKTFEEINKDLKLENTVDWGVANDDADRVKEFIDYYNRNINDIDKSSRIEFIDLVFSSMNEALVENKVDDELRFLFSEYLYSIEETELNLMIIANWASYDSTETDPFPVSDLIKNILRL